MVVLQVVRKESKENILGLREERRVVIDLGSTLETSADQMVGPTRRMSDHPLHAQYCRKFDVLQRMLLFIITDKAMATVGGRQKVSVLWKTN